MAKKATSPQTTIKLSLRGVFLGLLVILATSVLGGIIGAQVLRPPLPPLTDEQQPFVTTVQEVTISPSRAAAELVATHERAIVLLAEIGPNAVQFHGTGVVLTNDGLVISTEDIPREAAAFDSTGKRLTLSKVGQDVLYGFTYYRLENSVIAPFQLAGSDPAVGSSQLAVTRSNDTLAPKVASWQTLEYVAPENAPVAGWQRLLRIASAAETNVAEFEGAPLIADDGALAGIIVDAPSGTAIPVSDIRSSLQRVTAGQREADPFTTWGISVTYGFDYNEDQTERHFAATITAVTPASPAAVAKLAAGDVITKINDTDISWTTNIAQLLTSTGPIQLTVLRNGQPQTVTLALIPPTS